MPAAALRFMREVDSAAAQRLQDPIHQLHVPSLFASEIANTIWKKLRRGELSSAQAHSIVAQLPGVPVHRHADGPFVHAAFELAERFMIPSTSHWRKASPAKW